MPKSEILVRRLWSETDKYILSLRLICDSWRDEHQYICTLRIDTTSY